jgi:BirA family biotin operon repressor/biotin-[acetyl-CoA-carboxylase] ligase
MDVHGDIWDAAAWPAGWTVRHCIETGSTNADLLADLDAGVAGDRSVLATGHQTAGRGRLDRRWDAPPGTNLLVSIALVPVPEVPVEATHRVGLAALAAVRDLRSDAQVGLKWPNDLLLDGRKLAGILAQRSSTRDAVVVGLGLNVSWAPEGAARLGSSLRPADVLARLLRHFDELPVDIGPRYRSELSTIGERVRVEVPTGSPVDGEAIDVDAVGRLVVRSDDGTVTSFDVGDVVHVRPGENRL